MAYRTGGRRSHKTCERRGPCVCQYPSSVIRTCREESVQKSKVAGRESNTTSDQINPTLGCRPSVLAFSIVRL
jgi:hypothetical protein